MIRLKAVQISYLVKELLVYGFRPLTNFELFLVNKEKQK